MLCRICEEQPGPTMTIARARAASAVCTRCGAGVCAEHGARDTQDGRIVCVACRATPPRPQPQGVSDEQQPQVAR